ncbi:Exonuclease SbcC [uncultured Pleomorphomonas sp.]|uniref:Exonuclease SbcC n=2 Tax=Pleomorphomonas TaxID=261933 RepID=A0A2G9WV58_9HYPH|nr:hypothetical protein [Pleomorphomonas carboxyditropha]PIO98598.1 hypothetical protein CJ014_14870 [Pleomorphomonas carboxyditropha]SCM75426.1 Exonuclease SbcC [uncultured Pleomorphomonas sp.]
MIEWLAAKVSPLVIAAALALGAAALIYLGIARIDGMVDTARQEAIAARDAHWSAQIAEANAKVSAAAASLARLAMQKDAELAEADRKLQDKQTEMEASNAALPGGDGGGISRDRVRLLNQR